MDCAVSPTLGLITAALIIVVLRLYALSSMKIHFRTAVSTVYIASVLVGISLPVGTLSSLIVLLNKCEQFSAYYRFMRILKYENVFGGVLDTLLQLIGLAVCLKVHSIAAINPIGQHISDRTLSPEIWMFKVRVLTFRSFGVKLINTGALNFVLFQVSAYRSRSLAVCT